MATISLELSEYHDLMNAKSAAENKTADLERQLQITQTSDVLVGHLCEALKAAREVVRFAVANLPPETVRGWPADQLKKFADLLETAPGATQDYRDMAMDLRLFSREADTLEQMRVRRDRIMTAGIIGEKPVLVEDKTDNS